MRWFKLGPAIPVVLAFVGCYVDSGRPPSPVQRQPAPYTGPYAPTPYSYPYPPPALPSPRSPPARAAGISYSLAQLAQAESQQRNAVRATPPPPTFNIPAQINLAGLARVMQSIPKGCAPFQAAPGVYVHLDCLRYARIATAKLAHPVNKLRLFRAGQLRLDPPIVGVAAPPLLLTGLEGFLGQFAPVAPAQPQQDVPSAVDHRAQGIEGPVKDQQLVGACTAFSLSSVMDNAIRRLNKTDVVSAMHIWSRYADPTMPSAESRNEGRPLAIWADYPYDERIACRMEQQDDGCAQLLAPPVQVGTAASDPAIQAQMHNADGRGRYTIAEIDQVDPIDPAALALDLATGKDIWFAMGVSQDAWTSAQVQSTGVVPDWLLEDGGHAFVLAGYRTTPSGRQFLVHNSWGSTWGDHGYGWISDAMIKAHAQYAYTVKVVDLSSAPPPPTPVPTLLPGGGGACAPGFTTVPGIPLCQKLCSSNADCGGGAVCVTVSAAPGPRVCVASNPLTDDDCGEDELVDLVTAQCAPACSNGSRPAAGFCGLAIPR